MKPIPKELNQTPEYTERIEHTLLYPSDNAKGGYELTYMDGDRKIAEIVKKPALTTRFI